MKLNKSITWKHVNAANLDLSGLRVAVIGGTGGIGRGLSQLLASRGASVLVVEQNFRDNGVSNIEYMKADLSLMREAQRIGRELPAEALDLVVFTVGIMAGPKREQTSEGLERDMAVSYLSRLVILREIGSRLGRNPQSKTPKPRVFIMGYPGAGQSGKPEDLNAMGSYSRWTVHFNTVAGNEALVLDAATRYPNATFFGLNPGVVKSSIRSNLFSDNALLAWIAEAVSSMMGITPKEYAARIVPLLVSPDIETHTGAMFDNKGRAVLPTPKLTDSSYANTLLSASERLLTNAGVQVAS